MASLDEIVAKGIELYNRFRKPEAEAELVEIREGKAVLVFKGSFCATCGVLDWIRDFCYVLEDLGAECSLERVAELDRDAIVAEFSIKVLERLNQRAIANS